VDSASPGSTNQERMWILLVFEGIPLLVGCVFTFIVYFLAVRKANQALGILIRAQGFSSYKLLWYPTLLFFVYVPSFIDNFLSIISPEKKLWVEILHCLVTHSIGFFNAIFYAFQQKSIAKQNQNEVIFMIDKLFLTIHLGR